jgi:hypothetical protein
MVEVKYLSATDRKVHCQGCTQYSREADVQILIRKIKVNLCLAHVSELVGELVDSSTIVKKSIYNTLNAEVKKD